ncbi:MAG: KH domain-containing protein [Dehalococcoidia bacterium]
MKQLVEYVAQQLVEHPEDVVVRENSSPYRTVYHLTVHEEDMGRVIGKQGRIAQAVRTLLKVAATRSGRRVSLEIGD